MIYTKRENLSRYLGLHPNLDTAIRSILSLDLRQLQPGRNEIDAEAVFVNRFDYQTLPEAEGIWEGHLAYGDVHLLLSGREQIGISHRDCLSQTDSKPELDFLGFQGPVSAWLPMTTQDVLIAFPEDIHKVKIILGESCLVEKACFKFML